MNYVSFASVALLSLLASNALYSQENEGKEKPDTAKKILSSEERLAKLVKLGAGVHEIKKDQNGEIVRCIIVGQSRISTSLGNAKGLEMAKDKAELDCSAKFVKWLKEEVVVYQSTDDETIILLEGTESDNEAENVLRESGKAVEKNSKKMESTAKGFVRGLTMLHKHSDDRTYTIVNGWSKANSDAVKQIGKDELSDIRKSEKKKSKGDLKEESATSDDAGGFFDDPK